MLRTAKGAIQMPPKNIKKLFKLGDVVGKGAYGEVWSAIELSTKKKVAIKKSPHTTEEEKVLNYCEIAVLQKLVHPNIVSFASVWDASDQGLQELWIVTELLEGGTLSQAAKVQKFSESHVAYTAREILKGISFLHQNKYAHRDIKSENVMLTIKGGIKLIDFGFCCDLSAGPRLDILGSPYWIPPEMVLHQNHSFAVDIWSFAICILEMFIGKPPNFGSALHAMFRAATIGVYDVIPDSLSDECKDFLKRCLVIDPAKRATAEELLLHPYVSKPNLGQGIDKVLKSIFVTNVLLENFGI